MKELEEFMLKVQLEYKLIRALNVIRLTVREKDTYKYFELIDEMCKRANRGQLKN